MSHPLWEQPKGGAPHKQGEPYPLTDTLKGIQFDPTIEPGAGDWQGGPEPSLKQAAKPSMQQNKDSG